MATQGPGTWNIEIIGAQVEGARVEARYVATTDPLMSSALQCAFGCELLAHSDPQCDLPCKASRGCPMFFTKECALATMRDLVREGCFSVAPMIPDTNTKTIAITFKVEITRPVQISESLTIDLVRASAPINAPGCCTDTRGSGIIGIKTEGLNAEAPCAAALIYPGAELAIEQRFASIERELRILQFMARVEHECGAIPSHLLEFARICIAAEVDALAGKPALTFPAISSCKIWLTQDEAFVCDCANLLWLRSVVRIFDSRHFVGGSRAQHQGEFKTISMTPYREDHIAWIPNIKCSRFISQIDCYRHMVFPACANQVELPLLCDERYSDKTGWHQAPTIHRLARPSGVDTSGLPFTCDIGVENIQMPKFGAPGEPGAVDAIVVQRVAPQRGPEDPLHLRDENPFEWDRWVQPDTLREQFAASAASIAPMLARFRTLLTQSIAFTKREHGAR